MLVVAKVEALFATLSGDCNKANEHGCGIWAGVPCAELAGGKLCTNVRSGVAFASHVLSIAESHLSVF